MTSPRLGRVDRSLLLAAAARQPDWTPLPVERDCESRRVARHRSIDKLLWLGLIEIRKYRAKTAAKRTYIMRTGGPLHLWLRPTPIVRWQDYRLTPAGAALVDAYRGELDAGRRIRWGRVPMPEPVELHTSKLSRSAIFDLIVVCGAVDHSAGSDVGHPYLYDPAVDHWIVCDDPDKLARALIFREKLAVVRADYEAKRGPVESDRVYEALFRVAADRAMQAWSAA